MTFKELANRTKPNHFKGKLLCLDPGGTTGWAFFEDGELKKTGQICKDQDVNNFAAVAALIRKSEASRVVCEEYRVYPWKKNAHTWSSLPVSQLIGVIRYVCHSEGISISMQTPAEAKNFCSDEKLKEWDYYSHGRKHAMDAVRHGCYHILFGSRGLSEECSKRNQLSNDRACERSKSSSRKTKSTSSVSSQGGSGSSKKKKV